MKTTLNLWKKNSCVVESCSYPPFELIKLALWHSLLITFIGVVPTFILIIILVVVDLIRLIKLYVCGVFPLQPFPHSFIQLLPYLIHIIPATPIPTIHGQAYPILIISPSSPHT
ncbi:hypothetical protein Lalb_Chr20g0116621 [Lupinus albus]|uniref:Uncharacterized protein n=1 Tax=Lupinus albus TaxID=3870 RepID=A0A6A4NPX5_LUPAL|nr:hypothetical protein Lalb_Chr20g0116621 [Lupinus albus]